STMILELTFNEIPQQGITLTAQDLMDHPLIAHAWQSILPNDTIRCLTLDSSQEPAGSSNAVSLLHWSLELSQACKMLAVLQRNSG
ncbi:MAG: hypothetical protein ACKO55_03195, partial [Bacteroidota bacterium]